MASFSATCVLMGGIAFSCLTLASAGDNFLKASPARGGNDVAEFQQAMEEVMGCGGGLDASRLAHVEKVLTPIWRVLPKNGQGQAEWRMLRYAAHRYFISEMSVLVRGFEPSRLLNASHAGVADILKERMPSLMQSVGNVDSFSLQDAVVMIASLERLIFDSESALLHQAVAASNVAGSESFSSHELGEVMELYMVHWLLGGDSDAVNIALNNPSLREQSIPHWEQVVRFAHGNLKSMEHNHHKAISGDARIAWSGRYSFDDAHEVVGGITRTFASYWETECQAIKASLIAMDTTRTGRVRLSDFYGSNSDGEWRFAESEAYLRELGALDESSLWRGKQVIIPNYLQGASNCIVSTKNYLVCCVNECEAVMNDVEEAIGAAVASAEEILPLVRAFISFDDEGPEINAALQLQLTRIAETHGGKVPLHGRLFAQWLHYVFPRECPFPHKAGTVSQLSPGEYGDVLATESEVASHAAQRRDAPAVEQEDEWMTQWSEEEELQAEYHELQTPWLSRRFTLGVVGVGLLAAVLGKRESKSMSSSFGSAAHAHFV